MSRQYGSPEEIAARRSPEQRERRFTAILTVLSDGEALSPNAVADALTRHHHIAVAHTVGHSGTRLGGGSSLSPVFQAMHRRGWIGYARRRDGRSGTAYAITREGREELAPPRGAETARATSQPQHHASAGETMTRPRLLDLFCGAGGCSVGYHRAGFDVVGVDINPQPRYPFEFHQSDAMTYPLDGFDVIHASPPCQDHSPLRSVAGEHGTGWMLDATLERLASRPAVWVVENVAAAHNRADFLLCGEMFGLRTVRHRRFTLDPRFAALLAVPPHPRHQRPTSTKNRVSALAEGHNLSITGDVGVHAGPLCMGIDWMTGDELSQAIPPAYTEYIGTQLIDQLAGIC